MNHSACILCNSTQIEEVEVLDVQILCNLYAQRARVDVSRFFTQPQLSVCQCKECQLLFYQPVILGDGKFYEDLQSYKGYYLKEKTDYLEAKKYISNTDEVLEIGCGVGFFTDFIQPKSYTGLEFNDKAIGIAQSKGLNVKKQSLEEHCLENTEKYDVVCFFQVLEHVESPRAFLQDALKCLKKGGKMILAVPSEDSFIAHQTNFYLNMPPHHATRWKDATLSKIAELFGIRQVGIVHEPLLPIHYEFYLKVEIFNKLRKIFNRPFKSLEKRSSLYVLASVLAKIKLLFSKPQNKQGQSVIAIYEK